MSKVKVGYKNLLDDKAIFKEIEANALLTAAYKYAKSESDEIYKAVIDEKVALVLNNELIEVDKWKYIKVNDGDRIEIVSTLSGGKGKFLGFLMIAIGVAAIVFAGPIAGALGGVLGTTIAESSVIMFGISQVLSGMARLLFSPDLPNSQGATRETQTYSWSGIKTTARSDTRIPIIYGTCMTGGNVISAFTDVHNNDSYLNMLISLGEGEIEGICQEKDTSSTCTTSDQSDAAYKDPAIFIDDQPLRNYSDVEWWYRTGTNTEDASKDQYYPYAQNKIPYFDGAREQITDGREITSSWLTYTTSKEVDSVDIHIKTPALYDSSGNGSPDPSSATIQLQFKEESEGSYHTYNFTRWTPYGVNQNGYKVDSYIDSGYIYGDVKPPTYIIKAVDLQHTTETTERGVDISWVSGATFEIKDYGTGNIRYETVAFPYSGADVTIPNVDPYVVHVTTSINTGYTLYVYSTSTITNSYQILGLTKTGIVKTIHLDFNHIADAVGRAKYDIQIKRSSDATSDFTAANNIYFKNIIETVNGDFIYPNTALLGLRIKATNQLSGGLPNTKILVKGLKVEVPTIEGLEDFDDLWYNDTLDRWETPNGTERTWDGITYTSNSIDENLVGYWALDENTGSTAFDGSGNGNDGTIYGSPSWVAGKSGYCLDFDGVNDYVSVPDDDSLDFDYNEDFTVCGWIKLPSAGQNDLDHTANYLFGKQGSVYAYSLFFYNSTYSSPGIIKFHRHDGTNTVTATIASTTFNDDTWHFISAKKDGSTIYFYVDGEQQGSVADTMTSSTLNSSPFRIGLYADRYLTGCVDEVRIYNRALSAAEISELYNDPRGRSNEYSENSMLCVRNLLLSERYGIGKYLTTSDLYNSGIVTAIKSCHKKWYPTVVDYLSWYSSSVDWNSNWNFVVGSGSGDSSTQTISASNANTYSIEVRANAFISQSVEHDFKITLSSVTGNTVNIYLYGIDTSGTNVLLGYSLGDGNGQHTITFTPTIHGIRSFIIKIENKDLASGNTENISFDITDLELKNKSNSAEHLHTMNGVIDSKQSATTAIYEACDSFRCWPVWFKGKYNFVLNEDTTPVHNITAGNIKEFRESFTPLSEIPYKVEAQYLDKDLDYEMKSLVAKTTDSTIPKARENTVGMKWLTDRKRVERELKFRLNGLVNVSQSVNFKCGLDSIHATAGDVVNIQHPLPQWGSGGRLLSYNQASAFVVLDEAFTFDDVTASFLLKYQTAENSFMTATVDTSGLSDGDVEQKITLKSWPSTNPNDDSVYLIGKTSSIKPFRLIKVARNAENEVDVDAIEHISSIYSEPALVVVRDNYSDLPPSLPVNARPNPPTTFSVTTTDVSIGIGFEFTVDSGNQNIKDIVIQMSTDADVGYQTLLIIDSSQKTARYVDNNLMIGNTYYFRAFCRTANKTSTPVYTNIFINPNSYQPTAPTGIHIKGANPNSSTFNDVNVTIQWNSVGAVYNSPGPLSGYVVKVYHDAPINANLLRTAFVKSEEYTYTFDNNISDSDTGTAYSTLVFVLQSQTGNNISSGDSIPFKVTNSAPSTVGTVRATTSWNNVVFDWDKSTENDHKIYKCRTKVGSQAYNSWKEVDSNTYTYSLNATDINLYPSTANVKIQVRDVDYFSQESSNNASVTGYVIVWADANDYTYLNGDNIASYSITGSKIAVNAVAASQIYVSELSAISANAGEITAGNITGVDFYTSASGKRVHINNDGIKFETGATAATYGDSTYKYGDSSRKYGTGVAVYLWHTDHETPLYISEERDVADIHLYDRSQTPTGEAEAGDVCCVGKTLMICTKSGNPGVWSTVFNQGESLYANKLGIGESPTEDTEGAVINPGVISLKEITYTPPNDAGYGKLYTKSNEKLYFQDGAGTEHELTGTNLKLLSLDYGGSLATMVSEVGSDEVSVFIDVADTLLSDLTIPANINLKWLKGCKISLNGYTLTISRRCIEAGVYELFTGSGTVTIGA